MKPGFFRNNTENAILSGALGAVVGSTFVGISLARYATPAGFIGPLGMLSGLAGFSVFRELGSQTEDQLVMVRFYLYRQPFWCKILLTEQVLLVKIPWNITFETDYQNV